MFSSLSLLRAGARAGTLAGLAGSAAVTLAAFTVTLAFANLVAAEPVPRLRDRKSVV